MLGRDLPSDTMLASRRDLSWQENIQSVIFDSFSSPHEEVKSAASYALGN